MKDRHVESRRRSRWIAKGSFVVVGAKNQARRMLTLVLGSALAANVGCGGLHTVRQPPSPASGGNADVPPPAFPSHRDWRERQASLEQRLLSEPSDAAAALELGILYRRQDRLYAAERVLERAVRLAPRDPRPRVELARVYVEQDKASSALRQADVALRLDPSDGEAWAARGLALLARAQPDEALEAFQRGWRASPPSRTAGLELVRWRAERGEDDEAARQAREILAFYPGDLAARELHARLLERMDRPAEAAAEWEWLVARGETGAEGYLALARLRHRIGEPRRAREDFEAAARIAPQHPELRATERALASGPTREPSERDYPPLMPACDRRSLTKPGAGRGKPGADAPLERAPGILYK